jgi:hypothetical protein
MLNMLITMLGHPQKIITLDNYCLSIEQYNEVQRIFSYFQFNIEIDQVQFKLIPFYECIVDMNLNNNKSNQCCTIRYCHMFISKPTTRTSDGQVSLILKYDIFKQEKMLCGIYDYSYGRVGDKYRAMFVHTDGHKNPNPKHKLAINLDNMNYEMEFRLYNKDDTKHDVKCSCKDKDKTLRIRFSAYFPHHHKRAIDFKTNPCDIKYIQ